MSDQAYEYSIVLSEVRLDKSLYWRHKLNREGFNRAVGYWYRLGHEAKEAGHGFPRWSDGISAEEYMAMSEQERAEFIEQYRQ